MIILDVKINNLGTFNDFHINFLSDKKDFVNKSIEPVFLPNSERLCFKDVNIILGANASGKTLFGKMMCEFQNLMVGRSAGKTLIKPCDKNKESSYSVIFCIKSNIYQYTIKANYAGNNLKIDEEMKVTEYSRVNTWKTILNLLEKTTIVNSNVDFLSEEETFKSQLLKFDINSPELIKLKLEIEENTEFYYRFANFADSVKSEQVDIDDETFSLFAKLLSSIDSNITGVRRVYTENNTNQSKKENSFYIDLKYRDPILVENINKLTEIKGLSNGTLESIYLIHLLSLIKLFDGVLYIDEQMAYMHTELSNALISQLIRRKRKYSQIFVTTHNENVMDLKLPYSSFIFFKKEFGSIKVVNPENRKYGKIKDLKLYVQNDYFETYPELDDLWELENE